MFIKVTVPYMTNTGDDGELVFTEYFEEEVTVQDPIVDVISESTGVRICKDCGETFVVSKNEEKWLRRNNLKPYKRCKLCREARKKGIYNEQE